MERDEQNKGSDDMEDSGSPKNPLDPLLLRLAQDFVDRNDLSEKLMKIFQELAPCMISVLMSSSL